MWRNVGRAHAEMAVIDRLWGGAGITVAGAQVLRDARLSGRPIVFTFVHLGNWELLAVAVQREGITLNVIYENLRNRFESRLAERSRRKLGYRLLAPTRSGLRAACAALQRGEAVAFAVDEYKAGNVIAPAFGRTPSPSSNLHYALRLARRFDALALPGYCLRTSPQAFVLKFLDPLADLDLSHLNALSESCIRAHLEQWYMLWRILPDGLMASE
jgi:lauroyl/myristoyl acyltransferase